MERLTARPRPSPRAWWYSGEQLAATVGQSLRHYRHHLDGVAAVRGATMTPRRAPAVAAVACTLLSSEIDHHLLICVGLACTRGCRSSLQTHRHPRRRRAWWLEHAQRAPLARTLTSMDFPRRRVAPV
jgi:hypothetical protein